MLRHLKNANELVLYASISCGAAFMSRLLPAFHFPIMLLRLGIFGYCFYIIAHAEGNRELAVILGGSLLIGMVGGYWDLIEVHSRYVSATLVLSITLCALAILLTAMFILKYRGKDNGKAS
jgi:hypothetical protein